ncbi:hypothetical protein QYE76_051964 [Lolium multiflorum]|uniref:Uncharacterized protein n=1 Tax=Lolium multiflorum TaxID=4521 RepID=A0AAD8WL27_LOLMU|nr:hypothetical protein QYE76_051964 [Lolium multiflorum]
MPFAAYLGVPGRASSGACRRPRDRWWIWAISWDPWQRVGHGGEADRGEKGGEVSRCDMAGMAMSTPCLALPWCCFGMGSVWWGPGVTARAGGGQDLGWNPYILDYKERRINAQECTHNLQEPVEEEIDEPESSLDEKEEEIDELESSLDEKEEESDEQKEEEWISYPCQPSNESNSSSLTLFDCPPCLPKEVECYVPVDSLEIFPISKTCENNYAAVIYDNPCYFDKSYDNALFVPDVEMHERLFGQYSRNWTKSTPKILFFPGGSRTPKGSRRRARGPPHHRAARADPGAGLGEATLSTLLRRLFAYLTPFDLKTQYQLTKLQKDSRGAAAIAKLQFGGQKSLFRHPAGTGKCPRKPSPSTPPPPPCSVSSSPMDYGF